MASSLPPVDGERSKENTGTSRELVLSSRRTSSQANSNLMGSRPSSPMSTSNSLISQSRRGSRRGSVADLTTRAEFQRRFLRELGEARGAGAATESMFKLLLDRMVMVEEQLANTVAEVAQLALNSVPAPPVQEDDDKSQRQIDAVNQRTDSVAEETKRLHTWIDNMEDKLEIQRGEVRDEMKQAGTRSDLIVEEMGRLRNWISELDLRIDHQNKEMMNLAHNVAGDTDSEDGSLVSSAPPGDGSLVSSIAGGSLSSSNLRSGRSAAEGSLPMGANHGTLRSAVDGGSLRSGVNDGSLKSGGAGESLRSGEQSVVGDLPPKRNTEASQGPGDGQTLERKDSKQKFQDAVRRTSSANAAWPSQYQQGKAVGMDSSMSHMHSAMASMEQMLQQMKQNHAKEMEHLKEQFNTQLEEKTKHMENKVDSKFMDARDEAVKTSKENHARMMKKQITDLKRNQDEELRYQMNENRELQEQVQQDLAAMKSLQEKLEALGAKGDKSETDEAELRRELQVVSQRLSNIQNEVQKKSEQAMFPLQSPAEGSPKRKSTSRSKKRATSPNKRPGSSSRAPSSKPRPLSSSSRSSSGKASGLDQSHTSKSSLPSYQSDTNSSESEQEASPRLHTPKDSGKFGKHRSDGDAKDKKTTKSGSADGIKLKKSKSDQNEDQPKKKTAMLKKYASTTPVGKDVGNTPQKDAARKFFPNQNALSNKKAETRLAPEFHRKSWDSVRTQSTHATAVEEEQNARPLSAFGDKKSKWKHLKKKIKNREHLKYKRLGSCRSQATLNSMGWEKALAEVGRPITEVKLKKHQTVSSRLNRIEMMLDQHNELIQSAKFQTLLNEEPKVVYQIVQQPKVSARQRPINEDKPQPYEPMDMPPSGDGSVVSKISSKLPIGVIDDESSLGGPGSSFLYNIPQIVQELAVTPAELSWNLSANLENLFRQSFDVVTVNCSVMTNDLWLHSAIVEAITHINNAITTLQGKSDEVQEALPLIDNFERLILKLQHLDETLVNKDLLDSHEHPEIWIRFQAQAVDVSQSLHSLVVEETKFMQELRNLPWAYSVPGSEEDAHFYTFPPPPNKEKEGNPSGEKESVRSVATLPPSKVNMSLRCGLVWLLQHISVVLASRQRGGSSLDDFTTTRGKRISNLKKGLNHMQWEKAVEIQEREMIKLRERVELTTAEYERIKAHHKKIVEALKKILDDKDAISDKAKEVLENASKMQEDLEKRMDTIVTLLEMKAGWKDVKSVKSDIDEVKDVLMQLRQQMPAEKIWKDMNRKLRSKADKNDIMKLLKSWEETEGSLRNNSTLAGGPSATTTRCLSCEQPLSLQSLEKELVEQVAEEIHVRLMTSLSRPSTSGGGVPELGTGLAQPGISIQPDTPGDDTTVNPRFGSAALEKLRPHTSPAGAFYRVSKSAHGSRRTSTASQHRMKPGPLGNARMSTPDLTSLKKKKKNLKKATPDGIRFGQSGEKDPVETLFANFNFNNAFEDSALPPQGSFLSGGAPGGSPPRTPQHMKVKLPKGEALLLENNCGSFASSRELPKPNQEQQQEAENKSRPISAAASPVIKTPKQKRDQQRLKVAQKGFNKK